VCVRLERTHGVDKYKEVTTVLHQGCVVTTHYDNLEKKRAMFVLTRVTHNLDDPQKR
jgi:hypothetical protein